MASVERSRVTRTNGYTLIELLVVLALLSVLAAFSWPAVRKLLTKATMRDAAKQVRIELARTRLRAIQTGMAQQFRYGLGVDLFQTGPVWTEQSGGNSPAWEQLQDGDRQAGSEVTSGTTDETEDEPDRPVLRQLPEGVQFVDPEELNRLTTSTSATYDSRDSATTGNSGTRTSPEELDSNSLDSVVWSAPIVFQPNGRATDARIRLIGPRNYFIDVTLRGLTGSVQVGELWRLEEQP